MAPPNKTDTKDDERSSSGSGFGLGALLGAAALGGAASYLVCQLLNQDSSESSHEHAPSSRHAGNQRCERSFSRESRTTINSARTDSVPTDQRTGSGDEFQLKSECQVCLENKPELIMIPCGHANMCRGCWDRHQTTPGRNKCITCRASVSRAQRFFL